MTPFKFEPLRVTAPRRRDLLALSVLTALGKVANAKSYPERPVRIVVPYQAGGSTDVVARAFADLLSQRFGQPLMVDNKAGASGILGTDAVAKAPPDGHTLLVSLGNSLLTNRFLYRSLPYDPLNELALVSQLAAAPVVWAVHPSLQVDNAVDLMRYIASHPGRLSYGSYGVGSHAHLASAHIDRTLNAGMVHVPYKGEAAMLQDLAAGQIQFAFCSGLSVLPYLSADRLKVVGTGGPRRLSILASVPTLWEQGLRDDVFRVVGFMGLAAPARTPAHVIDTVAAAVLAIGRQQELRQRMENMGLDPVIEGQAAFKARYEQDEPVWRKLVRDSGAQLD